MTYSIAGTAIIYEHLNDEIIIANLDEGIYYSIRGSGCLIWPLLLAGHTPSAIESLLSQKYGAIPSILPFIERLVEEKILSLSEEKTPNSLSLSWPAEFSFPTLERYDEMKNLLMLDPIHEVNEQGWPQRK